MKAEPISLPSSRPVWIMPATAIAWAGVMLAMAKMISEVMPSASPTASTSCDSRKSCADPVMGQPGIHPAADRDQREAEGEQQARIDVAQQPGDQRHQHDLRQRDPVSTSARSATSAGPARGSDNPAGRSSWPSRRSRRPRSAAPGSRHWAGAATARSISGCSATSSLTTKAASSSPPATSRPTTVPELSQSSRLPWSSAA